MTPPPSYVELVPVPALAGLVRTVWVQRTGDVPYVQRHLPTGGAELHWPLGGQPRLLGPLTGPLVEVIPAGTTLLGVRFRPGATGLVPGDAADAADLVDQHVAVGDPGRRWVERLGEAVCAAATPTTALRVLQDFLLTRARAVERDPLVAQAVRLLMPWPSRDVGAVADHLALSASQLRRRCLHAVGVGPKSLQRTLRFQGLLALAQSGGTGRRGAGGVAGLAARAGYADQAHLSREVRRLAGLTPGALLGDELDRCACGHDHSASYAPFLALRRAPAPA